MKTLVDDFSVLAIERYLQELPKIFSPEIVTTLDDTTIERIAAETKESVLERTRLMEKLKVLTSSHETLKGLDRQKPVGSCFQKIMGAEKLITDGNLCRPTFRKLRTRN